MPAWPEPVSLQGSAVRLEPLRADHHDDLVEAVRDGELWKLWYTSVPTPEGLAAEIERRLGLQWLYDKATTAPAGAEPAMAFAAPAPLTYPDAAALLALSQAVSLGYYRGILNTLDDIERSQPAHSAFVGTMRQLAKQFQFDAMGQILEQAP